MFKSHQGKADFFGDTQAALWSRICLPMQGTQVLSLGQEDPLEEEMATNSSILA